LTNNAPVDILSPADMGVTNSIVIPHAFSAEYKGETWTADGVLSFTSNALSLVVFTPVSRLFTLTLDAERQVNLKTSVAGPRIPPEYLLMDIQLMYAPIDKLNQQLGAPYRVTSEGLERHIHFGNDLIVRIRYSTTNPFTSDISFSNLLRNYRYALIPHGNAAVSTTPSSPKGD